MYSFIYFLIALFTIGYVWVKRRYNYWNRKGITQVDGSFPFGSLKGLARTATTFEIFDVIYNKFKGKERFLGIYEFLSPSLLILDPELIKEVVTKEFPSFNHRGMFYNKEVDPASAK